MRNGGLIDEEYDDSDDAKEQEVEAFKAERIARARARAEGTLPVVRQRKPGREEVDLTPVFDIVTGDLSFISLTLVLPAVVPLLAPQGRLLMLVKPQFELQPGQVGKGGIVRDETLYSVVEKRIRDCCAELGLEVLSWMDSPIQGGDGNREFFVEARRAA
jgi:23S rRNA (cytidine1920-2'-O)/16S rRNA (cytidine1409-2'-O)-methyltransferase